MNEVDDAILEFLAQQGDELTIPPTVVWYNLVEVHGMLSKSQETVARRMRKLPELGLLEKADETRGYYRITEKGQAYLAGELDAEDLEKPDE